MTASDPKAPVQKSVVVRCDIDVAFRTWTERTDAWWPKAHSRSGDPGTSVVIEKGVGGRIYERTPEGIEYEWGKVTAWEPPSYLAYEWYLGSGLERPTQVGVHFTQQEDSSTRVEVIHRGPDLIGDLWLRNIVVYNTAWNDVLAAYAASLE